MLLGENYGTELLNVGSCGLHKVHDACKTAMVAAGWGLEKVLKSMYRLLEDTPARREDYFKTSQCTQAPLKFCAHRWLENSKVAQGAFDILPHFKKFCDSAAKKEITQPQTESFETVRTAVNNDMFLSSKLAFFVSFSKQLEPFLRKYQTDNPMVPFLFTDLHNLTFAVLRRFVKKEIIANLSSTSDILNFSVNDPQNHVTGHAVDIGFVADSVIKDLKRERKVTDLQILNFKNDCKLIMVAFMEKFLAKSPLQYLLVKDLACLDPSIIIQDKANAAKKLKRILQTLVKSRKFNATECDAVIFEFVTFIEQSAVNGSLSAFSRETDRLDSFYHDLLSGRNEFQNVWSVVQMLLMLSHGQATVERGFSVNKEMEEYNMAERTLISRRVIVDHIRNQGGVDNIEITPKMLTSASSAHSRYMLYLDSQKEKTEQHTKKAINKNYLKVNCRP
ncbi:unnamed protein product [Candidula unifasciata]|uniref:Uncharacterized protein n=1 Tax=Candidula unifasciata TaxID=100452 RepID=A0A8S3Z887_9EUPU|nr:unnamed protein product [Candidula unifasciata]